MNVDIVGLHHVNIQAADVAATRAFYGDVLGLPVIERPDFDVDGIWFQLGAQQLHIGTAEDHRGPDRQHFAIQVVDLDVAVATIESRGGAVRKAAKTFPGAGRQAFLRDPSGNLIELNQPD